MSLPKRVAAGAERDEVVCDCSDIAAVVSLQGRLKIVERGISDGSLRSYGILRGVADLQHLLRKAAAAFGSMRTPVRRRQHQYLHW